MKGWHDDGVGCKFQLATIDSNFEMQILVVDVRLLFSVDVLGVGAQCCGMFVELFVYNVSSP